MALFISVSAIATPNTADAWVWFVAKKLVKKSKSAPKQKNSWWSNEGKEHKGWNNGNKNDPDWKQLNYREKDWND